MAGDHMARETHTPGPWMSETTHVVSSTAVICQIYSVGHPGNWDRVANSGTRIANAHLIAAAPDLYVALMLFVEAEQEWREEKGIHRGAFDDPLTRAFDAAHTALQKAQAADE